MPEQLSDDATERPAAPPPGLKTLAIGGALIALVVVAVGSVNRAHATAAEQVMADENAIPTVQLVSATAGDGIEQLTLPGTVQAWNAANIFARVPGYVRRWQVDIGAHVAAGAVLATIDTPELDQQIARARAQLTSARAAEALATTTAARWHDLLATNAVSQQESDEKAGELAVKRAAVTAAQAELARLQALKAYATVRAPFAGIITARNVQIGDLVGPGAAQQTAMFALADTHMTRIYVSVPQATSARFRAGQTATLTVPEHPGRRFTARVAGDSAAVNGQTGTFLVQLVAGNADGALKAGDYAQVDFALHEGHVPTIIPASALSLGAHGTNVATVDARGHVHLHPISIGRDLGDRIEVASGLRPGERIVDNPPDSIAEGELVRVSAAHG